LDVVAKGERQPSGWAAAWGAASAGFTGSAFGKRKPQLVQNFAFGRTGASQFGQRSMVHFLPATAFRRGWLIA